MDTSDEKIYFDSNGICNHCTNAFLNLQINSELQGDEEHRYRQMINMVRESPGNEGFHAVIGISGGLDSSFLLHKLSRSGLKLLAVHVDAGWNSIEAVKNINKMVSILNLDLETIVINWQEIKDLQLSYLRSGVANQDVPQDHAFFGSLFRKAQEYNIKYVMSGSNIATESILPSSWGQFAMDGRQLLAIQKVFGQIELRTYPVTFLHKIYFQTYIRRNYRVIAPLNFGEYSRAKAIQVLQSEYGWLDYGGKHKESKFTDFYQEIYLPERFGIEKKRTHLSSLIVNSEITRSQAIEILSESRPSQLERDNTVQFIAGKLGISSSELERLMLIPLTPDKQYKNQGYLKDIVDLAVRVRGMLQRVAKR
jgi:N-acetyl sugar amidotransferase